MTEPIEEWRSIPGYEGYYEASNRGRVRSVPRVIPNGCRGVDRAMPGKIIKSWGHSGDGRPIVALSRDGVVRKRGVHILVALAFHGPRPREDSMACHRDGNVHNNTPENLYWGDASTNMQDAIRHGTFTQLTKTHCPQGHELREPNLLIGLMRTHGRRGCRACSNTVEWARRLRLKGKPPTDAEKRAYADRRYADIMTPPERKCLRGHLKSPENSSGRGNCRACTNAHAWARYLFLRTGVRPSSDEVDSRSDYFYERILKGEMQRDPHNRHEGL